MLSASVKSACVIKGRSDGWPERFLTQISSRPPRSVTNASALPSGDQTGSVSFRAVASSGFIALFPGVSSTRS
jgi:hypothetical protein